VNRSANGAEALLRAARAQGLSVCFANPGTTELSLVRALEAVPGIRPVLGLFEGVCTGAADGYARVTGETALTLLHLGPGFANGIANLHNARRAGSPIVNLVGDHATWHRSFDAPLTSDIDGLARPVGAVVTMERPSRIARDVAHAARTAVAGGIVTMIVPTDIMDAQDPELDAIEDIAPITRAPVPTERIVACAGILREKRPVIFLLGGSALHPDVQAEAAEIAQRCGARLLMETYPAIVSLGGTLPRLERLAYFPDDVIRQIDGAHVVLIGAKAPVSYFGYEGYPSLLVPEERMTVLAGPHEDVKGAVATLWRAVADLPASSKRHRDLPHVEQTPELTPGSIVASLIEQLPEDSVISLEGSTLGGPWLQQAHKARRHRVMTNTGGAIGQGLPCAVGAAIGAPGRRIVSLQSDGSAQYTVQALWTMAREGLDVTIIIAANHRYGILQTELRRGGADVKRPVLERLTDLGQPRIDWVALAAGYGVAAERASSAEQFDAALGRGLAARGPYLIEAVLA